MTQAHRLILRRARISLIALGCAILLTTALIFGSSQLASEQQQLLQQENGRTGERLGQIAIRQADLEDIEQQSKEFRRLQKQGLLDAPDREFWVEQLLAAQKQLALPETLVYALQPPQPLIPAASATEATGSSAASIEAPADPAAPLFHDLEIKLRDIHEGELLALLSRLHQQMNGRFRVQACRLANPTANGLSAECTLRFFTLPTPAPQLADSPLAAPG
jgi:ABC-type multidrug transport system fused ATPase/permease subunit